MISKKGTNILLASAIFLLAIIIALTVLAVHGAEVLLYFLIIVDVALLIAGGYLKRKRRSMERGTAKSARASVLKHRWEEHHRREW
jgi:hypothetical protein